MPKDINRYRWDLETANLSQMIVCHIGVKSFLREKAYLFIFIKNVFVIHNSGTVAMNELSCLKNVDA